MVVFEHDLLSNSNIQISIEKMREKKSCQNMMKITGLLASYNSLPALSCGNLALLTCPIWTIWVAKDCRNFKQKTWS